MSVNQSALALTWRMWLWWVMIHIEGSTDVTLSFEDNDGWIFRENFQILGTITIGSNVLKKKLGQKVILDQVYSWIESNCIWKFVSPKYNCIHEVNRIVFVVFRAPSTSSPNYTKYGSATLNWGIPSTSKWVHNRYIGLMCDSEYRQNT